MNEAELLFTEIMGCDRASLYLGAKSMMPHTKAKIVSSVLKARSRGEPIQYILGETEFMGLKFKVSPSVLIPRPETEILTEKTIELLRQVYPAGYCVSLLDIGTGSGCIAVSLAAVFERAKITALDISCKALKVARLNAKLNNVSDKISFLKSDLFERLEPQDRFDVIVSNPPYIKESEFIGLQPEIGYEPRVALDGGCDGLRYYRDIVSGSSLFLKKGGFLIMEIGCGQLEGVKDIIGGNSFFSIIESVRDYNGIDRVVIAKRKQ